MVGSRVVVGVVVVGAVGAALSSPASRHHRAGEAVAVVLGRATHEAIAGFMARVRAGAVSGTAGGAVSEAASGAARRRRTFSSSNRR